MLLAEYELDIGTKRLKQVKPSIDRLLARVNVSNLTVQDLTEFRRWLAHAPLINAASTRNKIMRHCAHYIRFLRREGVHGVIRDDVQDAFRPFRTTKDLPVVLGREDIRKLVVACESDDSGVGAFTLMALLTGARPGEVMAFTPADVNTERRELVVRISKTGVARRIPLTHSRSLSILLLRMCVGAEKNKPLLRRLGTKVRTTAWRKFLDAAGLEGVKMKDLRSTASAYAASSGKVPEYILGSWFGHTQSVANAYYRLPIHGVNGDKMEDWFGCPTDLTIAARRVHIPRPKSSKGRFASSVSEVP